MGVFAHKQPILEKYVRTAIDKTGTGELRSSCTLTSISEDADWVYATYSDPSGIEKRVRAKFLAAADGKTGYTRKMYLEPKGITLDWAEKYVSLQLDLTKCGSSHKQNQIRRDLGSTQLEATSADQRNTSFFSIMGSWIFAPGCI